MAIREQSIIDDLCRELTDRQPGGYSVARGMPAAYYTSPDFLTLEEEEIFRKEWICLGHSGEIPNPGDYITTDLVGEPLLVVRNDAGEVRVLSNVCRHRGNLVATGKGNKRNFTCAYHAWSYGRSGELKAAPLMDSVEGFDKNSCALPDFKVELWCNFIFINLDRESAPLAPRLEGLQILSANYHIEERNLLHSEEDTWATNWKSLTENFMEGYHLSITHRKTLHAITPTSLARKLPGGEGYTAYASGYAPDFPQRGPFHEDLSEEERKRSLLFCVYPSFVTTTAPNCTLFMCIRPDGASKVAIHWGVIGHAKEPSSQEVEAYINIVHSFNAEDKEKLETLQKGLQSRYYEPGYLGPEDLEGTIRDFYGYMATKLGSKAH